MDVLTRSVPLGAPRRLSLAELLRLGTLDARSAALCRAALDRHGSLLVAGLEQNVGKTTLLDALLEALPHDIRPIGLRGGDEDFAFLPQAVPDRSLLYVNELSDHLPHYLWGARAVRALALVGRGFALAGTLHADGAADTVRLLTEELGAPARDVARVDLVATIRAVRVRGRAAPLRRLVSLDALGPDGPTGVRITPLATYDPATDRLIHHDAPERAVADPAAVAAHEARLARETMSGGTSA